MNSHRQQNERDAVDSLLREGRFEDAAAECQRILAINPADLAARFQLGNAQAAIGHFNEAAEAFEHVIDVRDDIVPAHFNLGNAYRELGRLADAAKCYQNAIRLAPQAILYNNLGTVLSSLGKNAEAFDAFREAIKLDPTLESAYINVIKMLADNGRRKEAVAACHGALERNPRSIRILKILGDLWRQSYVLSNAIACFESVLNDCPEDGETHLKLAATLIVAGEFERAETHLRSAEQFGEAASEIADRRGELHREQGQHAEAIKQQRNAIQLDPERLESHSNLLLTLLYSSEATNEQICDEAQTWAQQHGATVNAIPRQPTPPQKLRVAYVLGGLDVHPVGMLIEPVAQHHDRERFDFVWYGHQDLDREQLDRLPQLANEWRNVARLSDDELAAKIQADEVDLLVDLAGHTWPSRLGMFSQRAAPIQISWLAWLATTGISSMDYVLGDHHVSPVDFQEQFVEQIERMPGNFICFAEPDLEVELTPLPRSAADGDFNFGCFNNFAAVTESMLGTWAQILAEAPHANLLIKNSAFRDARFTAQVRTYFQERGVETNRLRLEDYSSRTDLLTAYQDVDLTLDTSPYNGGLMTLESLWMGVPVLTLEGDRFSGRTSSSYLRTLDLDTLVTSSIPEYRQRAVQMAASQSSLEEIRYQLRERLLTSSICDCQGFTTQLEDTFQRIWNRSSQD